MKLVNLIRSSRPKQYTKNLIVFSGPLFTFRFNQLDIWIASLLAFICLCLISSAIYLLNDSIDIKSDRKHPQKRFRPIAAGLVTVREALISAILFAIVSFIIAFSFNKLLFICIFSYAIVQLNYCLKLKNIPILEFFCISSGFILRAVSGGIASDIQISSWFILSVGFMALFLAIEKRKAEVLLNQELGVLTKKVLEDYSIPLLLRFENLVLTGGFISYSLWASGPSFNGSSTNLMLFTVPIILLGIFRYQLITDPKQVERRKKSGIEITSEKPEDIFLRDKEIKIILFTWLITTIVIGILYK